MTDLRELIHTAMLNDPRHSDYAKTEIIVDQLQDALNRLDLAHERITEIEQKLEDLGEYVKRGLASKRPA